MVLKILFRLLLIFFHDLLSSIIFSKCTITHANRSSNSDSAQTSCHCRVIYDNVRDVSVTLLQLATPATLVYVNAVRWSVGVSPPPSKPPFAEASPLFANDSGCPFKCPSIGFVNRVRGGKFVLPSRLTKSGGRVTIKLSKSQPLDVWQVSPVCWQQLILPLSLFAFWAPFNYDLYLKFEIKVYFHKHFSLPFWPDKWAAIAVMSRRGWPGNVCSFFEAA